MIRLIPGEVAAGPGQAGDEAGSDQVIHRRKRRLGSPKSAPNAASIPALPEVADYIPSTLRPTSSGDQYKAALIRQPPPPSRYSIATVGCFFDVAGIAQPVAERSNKTGFLPETGDKSCRASRSQALPSAARGERQRSGRAAEKGEKIAAASCSDDLRRRGPSGRNWCQK